jgi:hypothetical protein
VPGTRFRHVARTATVIRLAIASGHGRLPFLIGLSALIFIPLGLLDAVDEAAGGIDTDRLDDLELIAITAETAVHVGSALLGQVLFAGAVSIAVLSTPPGEGPSLRRVIRQTRWGALIAIDLLFTAGMMVSLLLLVVPALFFFARYVLAAVLAEIEELGVSDSFRRSAQLTLGSRRLVFGILFTAAVVGDLGTELAKEVIQQAGVDTFLANWLAASGVEILFNPILALLAVALALELGADPVSPSGRGPDPQR